MELNSNIGITGAKGFFGKHLVDELKNLNFKYSVFTGDLLDKKDVEDFFNNHEIDTIIHLVGTFEEPFLHQMDINFMTTQNILEVGGVYNLKKIIYSSTGAVYGEPFGNQSYESDICIPNTFYGLSKKLSEELIQYYSNNLGLTSIILRYPNIYGPGSSKGVVYNFTKSIKEKKSITVYGDGTQIRNFLYIDDAVQSIIKAVGYNFSGIFNIANNNSMSINDIIEEFKMKYDFSVEYMPSNNNLKNLILNTDKARQVLNFDAQYNHLVF